MVRQIRGLTSPLVYCVCALIFLSVPAPTCLPSKSYSSKRQSMLAPAVFLLFITRLPPPLRCCTLPPCHGCYDLALFFAQKRCALPSSHASAAGSLALCLCLHLRDLCKRVAGQCVRLRHRFFCGRVFLVGPPPRGVPTYKTGGGGVEVPLLCPPHPENRSILPFSTGRRGSEFGVIIQH